LRRQLHVKREWLVAHNMLPGKVFTYNSGFYGLSFLLRLMEIEHAGDDSAKATLTVEWDRSKWPSIYIPPPFQGPGGFKLGPRGIWRSRIVEVPYLMQDHKFVTQIAALAVKGDVHVTGYRVWASFDTGLTYQLSTQRLAGQHSAASMQRFAFNDRSVRFHLYGVGHDEIVVTQNPAINATTRCSCFIGEPK
jgi:hypothetical protein